MSKNRTLDPNVIRDWADRCALYRHKTRWLWPSAFLVILGPVISIFVLGAIAAPIAFLVFVIGFLSIGIALSIYTGLLYCPHCNQRPVGPSSPLYADYCRHCHYWLQLPESHGAPLISDVRPYLNHPIANYALQVFAVGTLFTIVWVAFNTYAIPYDRVGGYRQLIDQHAVATARATVTHCDDHGRVNYSFDIGGKSFVGETYWLPQPCYTVRPGFTFPVNYDPGDPTLNTTMEPGEAYYFHVRQFCFKLLWVGGVVFFLVRGRFRKSA
jgi:hypothetical protein